MFWDKLCLLQTLYIFIRNKQLIICYWDDRTGKVKSNKWYIKINEICPKYGNNILNTECVILYQIM